MIKKKKIEKSLTVFKKISVTHQNNHSVWLR